MIRFSVDADNLRLWEVTPAAAAVSRETDRPPLKHQTQDKSAYAVLRTAVLSTNKRLVRFAVIQFYVTVLAMGATFHPL